MKQDKKSRGRPLGPSAKHKQYLPNMAQLIAKNVDLGPYKAAKKVLQTNDKNQIDSLARCWKFYGHSYLENEREKQYQKRNYIALLSSKKLAVNFCTAAITRNQAFLAKHHSFLLAKEIQERHLAMFPRNSNLEKLLAITERQERLISHLKR